MGVRVIHGLVVFGIKMEPDISNLKGPSDNLLINRFFINLRQEMKNGRTREGLHKMQERKGLG